MFSLSVCGDVDVDVDVDVLVGVLAMLCFALRCYATLYGAMLYYALRCYATLYSALIRFTVPRYTVRHYTVRYYAIRYHASRYNAMLSLRLGSSQRKEKPGGSDRNGCSVRGDKWRCAAMGRCDQYLPT